MDWMTLGWKTLLARGMVGVIFGGLAMAWPDETVVVIVVLWGCWALVDGLMTVGLASAVQGAGGETVIFVLAALSLAAAFFALVRPGMAATALTWFIGLWLVVRGLSEILGAFTVAKSSGRWVLVLSGVVDGVIGALFIANPGKAALSIAFVLGMCALVWGLVFVVLALVVRRSTDARATAARTDVATG